MDGHLSLLSSPPERMDKSLVTKEPSRRRQSLQSVVKVTDEMKDNDYFGRPTPIYLLATVSAEFMSTCSIVPLVRGFRGNSTVAPGIKKSITFYCWAIFVRWSNSSV
ncbi:hypothetical protein CEXT_77991 [Caerostris extrusa]|uniref:Uncharacterized protein n=1 Tax=Caerostris extrusa TaxID=172846 RepID=A0AAV4QIL9_CAEEX|nr:hypothetical protein CEXT_77991 [Caerostris extrusa]